jgi:hypothetical protein
MQSGERRGVRGRLDEIEAILAKVADVKLSAVISSDDYPGSSPAAIVAQGLGLPGPAAEVILICQHKYLSGRRKPSACPRPCRLLLSSEAI